MNTILIMIVTTAIFFIGIQVGRNLKKDEKTINMPKIEEIKRNIPFTEEYKQNQKERENIIKLNKIMNNVDNFNGKKEGQVYID